MGLSPRVLSGKGEGRSCKHTHGPHPTYLNGVLVIISGIRCTHHVRPWILPTHGSVHVELEKRERRIDKGETDIPTRQEGGMRSPTEVPSWARARAREQRY